jgi:Fe-S cluster assembly protein SufB
MVLKKYVKIYRRRLKIELENKEYEYGFYTELEAETFLLV